MADDGDRGSLFRRVVTRPVDVVRGVVDDTVNSSARMVVDDIEPYLTAETIPRLLDALMPDLIARIVPAVVDGVTEHLVAVTVPDVVAGTTPVLADDLLPVILERLRPYLEAELVPAVVDALTPHIIDVTAPAVLDALMPRIRTVVVPQILEDVAHDPAIRDLVRNQSLGLVVDAFERARRLLARGDDLVEGLIRRLVGGRSISDPVPTADLLPGRTRSNAGLVTRAAGTGIDLALISFVAGQAVSATLAVAGAIVDPIPSWLLLLLAGAVAVLTPTYLAVCWAVVGRTVGGGIVGYDVVSVDGRRLRPLRALIRASTSLYLAPIWALGSVVSVRNPQRRALIDLVVGSRTPFRSRRRSSGDR